MPNCPELLDNLSDYLDGLLDGRAVRRLEGHVRHCRRCSAALAALRAGLTELRAVEEPVPSPEFRHNLAQRLSREVAIGDPIQPSAAGIAALMVVGAAVVFSILGHAIRPGGDVPLAAEAIEVPAAFPTPPAIQTPDPATALVDVTLPAFSGSDLAFHSRHQPLGTIALVAR